MFVLFSFTFILSLNLFAFQQDFDEVYELDGKLEKTFDVSEEGFLKIKNISGYIRINSWDKNQVKITAYERRRKPYDEIAHIWIEKSKNRVYIETEYDKYYEREKYRGFWKRRRNRSYPGVEYEINVPEKFEVEASNVSGDIIVENIYGRVEGTAVSGDVLISNVNGPVFAKSVSGRIKLNKIEGEIETRNVSGGITIYDSSIPELTAKTVSGKIDIESKTINPKGRYELNSVSGSIYFAIPSDAGASIRIKYRNQNFRTDFDLREEYFRRDRRSRRYFYDEDWGWKQKTIIDDINGGGGRIYIESFNGRIELRKLK